MNTSDCGDVGGASFPVGVTSLKAFMSSMLTELDRQMDLARVWNRSRFSDVRRVTPKMSSWNRLSFCEKVNLI